MTTFQLGTISFNTGTPDADGITWIGYVDGWDTTENDVQEYTRPAVHGAITTMNTIKAKQMTLFATGVFDAPDPENPLVTPEIYYTARDKLDVATASFNQFAGPQVLLIVNEEVNRALTVYRTSYRTRCLSGVAIEVELTMRADDPIKVVVS